MSDKAEDRMLSFEEFKLYYESTERVTDRRLQTNRWNYSVCIAILVAVSVLTKWSLTAASLFWVGLSAVIFLCFMAVLFCFLWIGQIRDFKKLNNAKFTVLNDMARLVQFDPERPGAIVSFCPFEKEWKKLSELNALDEIGKSNIIALKSSNIEYFIPKAFAALFSGIVLLLLIAALTNWQPTQLIPMAAKPTNGPAAMKQQ